VDPELFSKRGKFKMHLALVIKGLKEHGKPLLGDCCFMGHMGIENLKKPWVQGDFGICLQTVHFYFFYLFIA